MSGPVEGTYLSFVEQILPPPQQDDMRFHMSELAQNQDVTKYPARMPMPSTYYSTNRDTQGAASAP